MYERGKWETEESHRPDTSKNGEREYTDEALALFNQPKIMNLWRALMSALDTEFKLFKKILSRVLNLNLPRTGQLHRRSSLVSNLI